MKKLNQLNLGKSLNREEMKSISAGRQSRCTCGTQAPVLTHCANCNAFCAGLCG